MSAPCSEASTAEIVPAAAAIEVRSAETGRAIALMVLSVGLFVVLDGMVKHLGSTYSTLQIVFFRSLFAFVPLGFMLFGVGSLAALRTRRPLAHALRALSGLAAMSCFFYVYSQMPLANAIAIGFAAPIFMTALSVPLLREAVGPRRWAAVVIGFLGVLIIVRPDAGVFQGAALIALAGTMFYALAMILVRRLSRTETSVAIVFYFTASCTLASGVFLPLLWVVPDLEGWILLIGVGLVGGFAQILMTLALRLADISVLAPFDYTALLWATLLGFAFWGELPGSHVWLGAAIVIASGIYILYREARLGLPRGIARRLQPRR